MFMTIERLATVKPESKTLVHLRTAFFLPGFYPSVNQASDRSPGCTSRTSHSVFRSLSLNQAGTLGTNTLEFFLSGKHPRHRVLLTEWAFCIGGELAYCIYFYQLMLGA